MKKVIMFCLLAMFFLHGPAFGAFNFIDNGNGTVTDTRTGLIWLKDANPCGLQDWYNAMAYCASLANGQVGLTDGSTAGQWRLPSKEELEGIGTDPPATWYSGDVPVTWTMPGTPFTNVQAGPEDYYWSSTGGAGNDPNQAWNVRMDRGSVNGTEKSWGGYSVWPVREPVTTTTITTTTVPSHGGTISFSDSTFNNADWDLVITVISGGGAVNAYQEISGGNPGEFRRIVNNLQGSPGIWVMHRRINAIYNPQTSGAIQSIDYSEDSIMFAGFGGGEATGPALLQNGIVYYLDPVLLSYQSNWAQQSLKSLDASDFHSIDSNGYFTSEIPDLSGLGPPITFGFFRANSPGGLPSYTIDAGIDNWSVTIFKGDNIKTLVREYYLDILDREPDQAGWDYWTSEIERTMALGIYVGEGFQAEARFFFNSQEYKDKNKTDIEFVTDLYQTFLQREPEAGGLTYWVGELSCLTRNMLITQFAYSDEFKQYMTNLFEPDTTRPENNLLNDLYRGFLNRFPENDGYNSWLVLMREAQCTGPYTLRALCHAIALSFVESNENILRNRNNAEYTEDLYNAILRRGAECAGFQFWVNELNNGASRAAVLESFTDSPEFQTRVQAVIDAGCLP
jgi:hypothetical protein